VSVRAHAYLASVLLLGAVLHPALLDPGADSFPLSTYPMFGRERPRRVEVMSALALSGSDSELAVPPSYIANAEAMQALQTLRKSVQAGRRSARKLCERIARELAAQDEPRFADTREIALVTTRVDALRFLRGPERAGQQDREPPERTVHVRCPVPGRRTAGPGAP
jgi:hypothetical protein